MSRSWFTSSTSPETHQDAPSARPSRPAGPPASTPSRDPRWPRRSAGRTSRASRCSRLPSVVAISLCSSGFTSTPAASDTVCVKSAAGVAVRAGPALVLQPHHVVHALPAVRQATDVRVEHESDDRPLDVVVHLLVRRQPLEHLRRRLLERLHQTTGLFRLQIGDVPRRRARGSPAASRGPSAPRADRRSTTSAPSPTHRPVVTGAFS